ncbi:MAG: hypothetical protein GF307_10500 [candidate division Zixibacteria bacterium]|nr:hypothetical protein [candidate division Zixibacteria bacterium]
MEKKVKNFRRFALFSTLMTYFVIFMGGLVRVSGAGLGCPDWPKCFGRWLPPTSVEQLPAHIDPSLFNFTLAWIEYFNRLVGALLGVFITVTTVWALVSFRKFPKILYSAIAAFFLVALTGWQGGLLIRLELEPLAVTIHMTLAFILVSVMIYLTLQAYFLENPQLESNSVYRPKLHLWAGAIWLVSMLQIFFGTRIRSAIEIIREQYPLLHELEWLAKIGFMKHFHITLGFILVGMVAYVFNEAVNKSKNPSGLILQGSWAMMILVVLQVITGLALIFIGIPPILQVLHLWISSIFFGTILIVYSSLKA